MNQPRTSVFEKHKMATVSALVIIGLILGIWLLNGLASAFGLGKVVVYQSHPIYGYRPIPNQEVTRTGATIKINNLSLRANEDWSMSIPANQKRILFIGDSVTYGGSYIDNKELFSTLITQHLNQDKPIQVGNAAANGWGVLNVTGLIMDYGFLPANHYVSVYPEGDFYRGMTRIGSMPFWARKPRFALEELWGYFIFRENAKKYGLLDYTPGTEDGKKIVNLAVDKLKQMDNHLKTKGYTHTIFITPSRSQLQGHAFKDKDIEDALNQAQLKVVYLWDELPADLDLKSIFHDEIHLEKEGHALWAKLIAKHLNL